MIDSSKPKTVVYIDGYNWYHAIFKHYPEWKWLNIQSYFEALRPDNRIESIKLFTAIVDEHIPGSDARERQVKFLDASKTLPKLKIILGKFQPREVTCRGACKEKYIVPEEKKTDVNIAVEIMSDAFADHYEALILVSGDSDAQPPIQWVKRNCPTKKIMVYIPALTNEREVRRLDFYKQLGVDCRFLPLDGLGAHQLPNVVKVADGRFVVRPASWKKPN